MIRSSSFVFDSPVEASARQACSVPKRVNDGVLCRERVTTDAVRFTGVTAASDVLSVSDSLKVFWIDAERPLAQMVDLRSLCGAAFEESEGDDVRPEVSPFVPELTVSDAFGAACPDPARRLGASPTLRSRAVEINAAPEAFFDRERIPAMSIHTRSLSENSTEREYS